RDQHAQEQHQRGDDAFPALARQSMSQGCAHGLACSSAGYCSTGSVALVWIDGTISENGNTLAALPLTVTVMPLCCSLIEALSLRAAPPPAPSTCRLRSSPAAAPAETAARTPSWAAAVAIERACR